MHLSEKGGKLQATPFWVIFCIQSQQTCVFVLFPSSNVDDDVTACACFFFPFFFWKM